ncbi:MAG: carboxypeptidase-like regulatory domain-containing protein [Janthinobacterium lividum]
MKQLLLLALLLGAALRGQAQSADPHTYTFPQATVETKVKAIFDSTSVFVDGRLLNQATKQPIADAVVTMKFGPAQKREKTVRTSESGYFRLGWVGSVPERRLTIQAPGYEVLETTKLPLGSGVHTQVRVLLAAKVK